MAGLGAYEEEATRTLEEGFRWMYFPPRLERLFEAETQVSRSRHLVAVGIVWAAMIVVYTIASRADRLTMPDLFGAVLLVRLGVVTPLVLGVTFAIWWGVRPLARELAMTVASIVAPASLIVLVALSSEADLSLIRGALTIVLLFITVVVRLRFWFATFASVSIIGILVLVPPMLGTPNPGNMPLLLVTVVVTLFANYGLERESRINYLQRVLSRIQSARLAEMVEQLQELSHRDALTGLPNRRALDAKLESLRQSQETFAVVLLDVDAFKPFNDRYGHQEGDDCLRRVAAMLRASLRRGTDSVSRVGGEEFAVVLPDTHLEQAAVMAERMRKAVFDLRIPHLDSPTDSVVSISAGVSQWAPGMTPAQVIEEADVALYQAKSSGRNRVVLSRSGLERGKGSPTPAGATA